jgi:hypothetical protein
MDNVTCHDHLIIGFRARQYAITDAHGTPVGRAGTWWTKDQLQKGATHVGYFDIAGNRAFAKISYRGSVETIVVDSSGEVVGRTDGWRLTIGDAEIARFPKHRHTHWVLKSPNQRTLGAFWRTNWADDPRVFHRRTWHLEFELATEVAIRQLAVASVSSIYWDYWDWKNSD